MSTIEEIKAAIRSLSPAERQRLAEDLPSLVPELDGDAKWQRIIGDPRPRPGLSALGDEIEGELRRNLDAYPEITDPDFKRNS